MNKNAHSLSAIAVLIDSGGDERDEDKLRNAIAALDAIDHNSLDSEKKGEIHYFYGNAWWNLWLIRIYQDPKLNWSWHPEEAMTAVYYYRSSLLNLSNSLQGGFRRYQALTNLGNILNTLGRVVEAQRYWLHAHDCSGYAQELGQPAGMAELNRGIGIINYAKILYDEGHTRLLQREGYHLLKSAQTFKLEQGTSEQIKKWIEELESFYGSENLSTPVDLDSFSLGDTSSEKDYRKWCLKECLFLNPLNEIGPYPIAASDIFHLPPLVTSIDSGPGYHGLFNQLKQEYIAARTFLYEGISASTKGHYCDKDTFMYDTLDYPLYGFELEKVRQAFRMAYSIFDKVAYFLNEYFRLAIRPNQIFLRRVWFENSSSQRRKLLSVFEGIENWPLRGLYFLSNDLYEQDTDRRKILEPAARDLNRMRNSLEHRYLKVHSESLSGSDQIRQPSYTFDDLAHSIAFRDFREQTLHLLRLSRAALIYLSLSIRQEEIKTQSSRRGPTPPISLPLWEPLWEPPG